MSGPPKYRGTVIGQIAGNRTVKVPTGKRFPMEKIVDGERKLVFIPIKCNAEVHDYVWDGDKWLTPDEWEASRVQRADFDPKKAREVFQRLTRGSRRGRL